MLKGCPTLETLSELFLTFSVVLCQKMARRNVAATCGVRKLEIDWM